MKTQAMPAPPVPGTLTVLILVLAALTSAGGLLLPELYRDQEQIKMAWFGNDLVTLVLAVPLLAVSYRQLRRGSVRASLVWLGLLAYMFYNYAFYLFGAAFNEFFLLYAALFSLSLFTLVLGLLRLDIHLIGQQFHPRFPVKGVSLFLFFISVPIGLVEAGQCLQFIFTGKVPEAPTLIFALDLSIVVPASALAAVLLWRGHPWGCVLAVMMLIKAFTYGLVLSLSTTLIGMSTTLGTWDPFLPFYVLVAIGGLAGSLLMLGNINQEPR